MLRYVLYSNINWHIDGCYFQRQACYKKAWPCDWVYSIPYTYVNKIYIIQYIVYIYMLYRPYLRYILVYTVYSSIIIIIIYIIDIWESVCGIPWYCIKKNIFIRYIYPYDTAWNYLFNLKQSWAYKNMVGFAPMPTHTLVCTKQQTFNFQIGARALLVPIHQDFRPATLAPCHFSTVIYWCKNKVLKKSCWKYFFLNKCVFLK